MKDKTDNKKEKGVLEVMRNKNFWISMLAVIVIGLIGILLIILIS